MKLLEWSEKYSVNWGEADKDHQIWFDLVNRLHHEMLVGKGVELLRTLSKELMQHTIDHFAVEEQFMRSVGFPGLRVHVQQHDEHRRAARAFMERFERGETTISIELMHLLTEAVPQHIMTFDRQFGEYLSSRNSNPKPND